MAAPRAAPSPSRVRPAGALRGCTGPVLLPHFTVAEHVALAPAPIADAERLGVRAGHALRDRLPPDVLP